ncbi:MAG: aminoacetone oxidase family FAD-binding enzyme [Eubacterium sp.]
MALTIYDLIIIGGGAAGMAGALEAVGQYPGARIAILEKKDTLGKKLRATGNGRCNLSNGAIPGVDETIAFFEDQGIPVRSDDTGRLYPFSESAPGLVETLTLGIQKAGIQVFTEAAVVAMTRKGKEFYLKTEDQTYTARRVLIATGGKAGPAYGCSGDGYALAKSLGHQVTKTLPVLTGVICEDLPKALKGVRVKGQLTLYWDMDPVFVEAGEIQLTDYGISGICAFNLSRHLLYRDERRLAPYTITLDVNPGESFYPFFMKQYEHFGESHCLDLLCGMLKYPLAKWVLSQWGMTGTQSLKDCTPEDFARLEECLHALVIKPSGVMGFKMAQCTAGGIPWEEVSPLTFESRLVPGLYFAGEILDYDGPCGGYNLDYAFRTGRQAVVAALSKQMET